MAKFVKGTSGNPNGRPRGSTAAASVRKMVGSDLRKIVKALVDSALTGDTAASKILIDRCIPAIRPQQPTIALSMDDSGSLATQGACIVSAMYDGSISPDVADSALTGLAKLSRIIEVDELEKRIQALEDAQQSN